MKNLLSVLSRARYLWSRWASKGFWAITDQALFAGTNFVVAVLLARWMDPEPFGAFTTTYSVFLLLGTIHTALWTEPLLVYGSGRFADRFGEYQGILLEYHWRYSVAAVMVFVLVGVSFFMVGQRELALGFLGLSIAAPLILFLWLARRSAYAISQPRLAAAGGALYFGTYLGGAYLLFVAGLLSVSSALLLMGVSALVSGRWLIYIVRKYASSSARRNVLVEPKEVLRMHWVYGRWALLASGISWVPMNLYYIAIAGARGLDVVASLRALMNIVMPMLQLNAALAAVLLPTLARWKHQQRPVALLGVIASLGLAALAAVYYMLIYKYGNIIINVIYDNKYLYNNITYKYIGMVPIAFALISGFGAVLRAIEKPSLVAAAWSLAALFTIMLLPFVLRGDDPVFSAVIATVVVFSVGGASMALLVVTRIRSGGSV